MRFFSFFLTGLILIQLTSPLKAQETYIGNIQGENGNPLSFCSVAVKNRPGYGTVSSYDGNFKLVALPNDTLAFLFVGYKTKYLPLSEKKKLVIKLKKKKYVLQEVKITPTNLTALEIALIATKEKWTENHIDYRDSNSLAIDVFVKSFFTYNDKKIEGSTKLRLLRNKEGAIGLNKDSAEFIKKFNIATYIKDSVDLKYFRKVNKKYSPLTVLNSLHSYIIPHSKRYFKHSFGEITFYNNRPVFHIKYHRKRGLGYCEGGGVLLVDREDFSVHYIEHVSKNCLTLSEKEDKNKYKVRTDYFKSIVKYKTHKGKNKKLPYAIDKIEKYHFSKNRRIALVNGYYKSSVVVNVLKIDEEIEDKVEKQRLYYQLWYYINLNRN